MAKYALGLGSNLGNREEYLKLAVSRLPLEQIIISSIYESDALLPENSSSSWELPYLNIVVVGNSEKSPRELLSELKVIESSLGRKNRGHWAPREIDIDILYWEKGHYHDEMLTIPHVGIEQRPFVIFPLEEVWPGLFADRIYEWKREGIPFNTRKYAQSKSKLMGILNCTEDSFSDGGAYLNTNAAITAALGLARAGACYVDLGAESTRPGAVPVNPETEWSRLAPLLDALLPEEEFRNRGCTISVDTRNAETAKNAIRRGVQLINDVSGARSIELCKAVGESGARYVLMHSLGIPADKKIVLDPNCDVVDFLLKWANSKVEYLTKIGLPRELIIFDPGIGFGKTPHQGMQILKNIRRFQELGVPIMVGHSRKSFLSRFTQRAPFLRDAETVQISLQMRREGVDILRVHNIELHKSLFQIEDEFSSWA